MPAALPKISLSSVSPTSEEWVSAMLDLMKSPQRPKAVGTAMMQWLNSNLAIGDNYRVAESRGTDRQELLVKFNTLQQRARNNYCIPKKIASVSRERIEEVFTWNNEIMDEVMGAGRAQALRDSGQVEWKPCPFTGSTEEHMKV